MIQKIDKSMFGSWAVVTGASSGIGREFARQLAANTFDLVLVARRQQVLEQLGAELADQFGINYRVVPADLTEPSFTDTLFSITNALDVGLLVSNAGTANPGNFFDLDEQQLLGSIHINAIAHFKLVRHYGKKMMDKNRGGIVLVSAMGALEGLPFMVNDAASKAYVASLGRGLNAEYRGSNVHTTVIMPGPTETPILSKLGFDAMPVKAQSVEACVAEGLRALNANRPVLVTGRLNRLMYHSTPTRIAQTIMGRILSTNLD